MENKTLTGLYSKKINRLAKVIYVFFYVVILLIIFAAFADSNYQYMSEFIEAIVVSIIIFELIKRAFYFIVLGEINPKK